MRIPIDRASATPLYEQIASFFRERCRSGGFPAGMRLPSARILAEELDVSRITTESAYAELEAEAVVERRRGSGTFVAARAAANADRQGELLPPAWQRRVFADIARAGPRLVAGGGLGIERDDRLIDLSSGIADPSLFPAAAFRKALGKALAEGGEDALGYGDPRGFLPFRESVARVLSSRGIDARPDEIVVTSGSQEGILLSALLACPRGGRAIVESPTYAATAGLFRSLGLELVPIPVDEGGMRIDALEEALRQSRPSLIYTMPNFQNPTGASLDGGRRKSLVALAERYAVPILEDDYVGDLRYEGRDLPALVSLGTPGAVIYTGTFSKLLAPGLRIGYVLARGSAGERLVDLKYCASLSSSNFVQRALHSIASVGGYENHLRRSRRVYAARRDALMRALAERLPGFVAAKPAGGLLAWARLPPGLGARRLSEACRASGVLIYPGDPCFPDPDDPNVDSFVRLNFAVEPEDRIEEGVRRIAVAVAALGAD